MEVTLAPPPLDAGSLTERERAMFRPSRTCYPGSKFGPKSRHDLPVRRRAHGNANEADILLFAGSTLEPQVWGHSSTGLSASRDLQRLATPRSASASAGEHLQRLATPRSAGGSELLPTNALGTPRNAAALSDAARSMFHPLAERNLPELPLIDERNDVHGVLLLGGKGSGKTSLILSFEALFKGTFPHGADVKDKRSAMPAYGQNYELPERDVRLGSGSLRRMRLLLTDTPACGTKPREEQPLCATVSPNSAQHFNAIPSWMRITLRSGNFPHYAVLFVVDATAKPLWEDGPRCRDLARLLAVLKRNQYTVVLAVTKIHTARETALRQEAHGDGHGGQVGRDPRTSYESFVGRYLDKVCASLQAKAGENDWSLSQGPDAPPFPLVNSTIFDAPSWVSLLDYKSWQERRGTTELPNARYFAAQLGRILQALSVRSHPE